MGSGASDASACSAAFSSSTSTPCTTSVEVATATSTSGWKSRITPFTRPMHSTYVIKAMQGMYRSGAFSSHAGGASAPLATGEPSPAPGERPCPVTSAIVCRAHFFEKKGSARRCSLRITYPLFTLKYSPSDAHTGM